MDRQEQNENTDMIEFEDFLNQMDDPAQWVLFLGDDISFHKQHQRRKHLFEPVEEMRREGQSESPFWTALCQAANQEDIMKLSSILFGNIWDGVSFLGDKEEIHRKHRNAYAKNLAKKEEIDLGKTDKNWKELMKLFRYMVITTCQDETIEAYLEYEQSMPVDEMVCTPYIMTTSSTWDRWIKKKNGDLMGLYSAEKNMLENVPVLVKLYGSCSMPHRLLLSKEDMEQYYPTKTSDTNVDLPLTAEFLKTIFRTKNILFVGVNFDDNHVFPLAEGIKQLLKKEPDGKKRYVFAQDGLSQEIRKQYHIKTIIRSMGSIMEPQQLKREPKLNEEQGDLSSDDILELFGKNYIRRPLKGIFPDESQSSIDRLMNKEITILKKEILELPDVQKDTKENGESESTKQERKWSRNSVRKLAIAANNLADFYDLKKVFEDAKANVEGMEENNCYDFYETVMKNILNERLDDKSRCLRKILAKYEKGFPHGFLQFLSEQGSKEEELREWKKAAIQLTNSGIYFNLNYRKNVQKRLSYADSVMQTAGTYPKEKRKLLEYKMQESCRQTLNSFFYPLENDMEADDADVKVDRCFQNLFVNLGNILANKTKDYPQVHSLLQTETSTIFKIAINYPDPQLEWKPTLYYELLLDSRMFPKDMKNQAETKTIQGEINAILEEFIRQDVAAGVLQTMKSQKYLEGILKLQLCKIMLMSRSLIEEKEYEDAVAECWNAQKLIEQIKQQPGFQNEMSEWMFTHKMQLLFIKQKIYSRRSQILEMKVNKNLIKEKFISEIRTQNLWHQDTNQLDAIRNVIETNLIAIENEFAGRIRKTGHPYKEFLAQYDQWKGEYYYKCILYSWENPKKLEGQSSNNVETDPASAAYACYKRALDYYNNYPVQYEIQQADVMRQLADLYCLQGGILKSNSSDEKEIGQLKEQCYDMLIEAYIRYRNNFELHGIADVLCSMRIAENLNEKEEDKKEGNEENEKYRSADSFIKLAGDLYGYLNDICSQHAVFGYFAQ